jgi:hypothetical protein
MADPHDDDAAALASLLQELAARSVSDQVAAVQRYRALLEEVASGRVDAGALRSRYDRLVSEQSAQLARDVSAIGMRFYQSMLDLHRASVERLFDGLAGAAGFAGANGGGEARPSPAPAAELVLRGGVGSEAQTRFVVDNTRPDPAVVTFLLSELAREGGDEAFRAPLELDPPRFRLEPRSEREVALRLMLDPALFSPGARYRGQLLVRSNEDLTLDVTVDVDG